MQQVKISVVFWFSAFIAEFVFLSPSWPAQEEVKALHFGEWS